MVDKDFLIKRLESGQADTLPLSAKESAKLYLEMKSQIDAMYKEIQERPVVKSALPWSFCPECGCEDTQYEDDTYQQCSECGQEWYTDVNYTTVVRSHLGEMRSLKLRVERLERELQDRSHEPTMMASDAYHYCADMIEPYVGDYCSETTLSNSVCESLRFLLNDWRKNQS